MAKAVGLEISGVDMIFRGSEPYVLEVNASSGFRGLLEATGINAADAMVDYAVAKAKALRPKRPCPAGPLRPLWKGLIFRARASARPRRTDL